MDNQFRNAAFGGFNRQDVMEYLERTAREHTGAVDALQAQLDSVQQERDALARELEQVREQLKTVTAQRDEAAEQARSLGRAAVETGDKVSAQADRISRQEQELTALRAQVEKLAPDAAAYVELKERTAGVELDAHRRAQGILDQAQGEADRTRARMEGWLAAMTREYAELTARVDATVAHAAGELDKVRQSLERISSHMDQQDGVLDGIVKAYQENK